MAQPNEDYVRYTREGEDGPDVGLYLKAVTDDAKSWFEAQKNVTKLEASERIGKLSGMLLASLILGLIVATVLVLWFVALALWLGQLLQNSALGFLAAGGLFLLLGGVFYLVWRTVLRDKVTLAVINAMHAPD